MSKEVQTLPLQKIAGFRWHFLKFVRDRRNVRVVQVMFPKVWYSEQMLPSLREWTLHGSSSRTRGETTSTTNSWKWACSSSCVDSQCALWSYSGNYKYTDNPNVVEAFACVILCRLTNTREGQTSNEESWFTFDCSPKVSYGIVMFYKDQGSLSS